MPVRKVLHVCPYLHPRAGGPAILVPQYARLLPKYGWESSILTTDWYSPGGRTEIESKYAQDLDVTVLATGSSRWLTVFGNNLKVMQQALQQVDLYHIHGLWHPLGWLVRRHAVKNHKHFVISAHGMLDRYSLSKHALRKKTYFSLFEKNNLQLADRIIFTSDEEYRRIPVDFSKTIKPAVVPLGADTPPAQPLASLREIFYQRYPQLRGRKILLFLGRLHAKKGLHQLISIFSEVVKKIPEATLLVVGEGDAGYLKYINKEMSRYNIGDRVLFTGHIENELKWSAMSIADVFALPSEQENFALSVVEVMKMGIPVVISREVGIWPYIEKADAGIVLDVADNDAWIGALTSLLLDEGKRLRMGAHAREIADGEFSWEKSAAGLAGVYNSVMNE